MVNFARFVHRNGQLQKHNYGFGAWVHGWMAGGWMDGWERRVGALMDGGWMDG
jgi:hypothetical protein